jgi:hypothetical protein
VRVHVIFLLLPLTDTVLVTSAPTLALFGNRLEIKTSSKYLSPLLSYLITSFVLKNKNIKKIRVY